MTGGISTMEFELNPDGVSIKGADTIYRPRGQALEYSGLSTNPYRGCGHACIYCYVPKVLKMSREEFDAGAFPRDGYAARLPRQAAKYRAAGITEQVMFSFTTDPFHPGDTSLTKFAIKVLVNNGLGFCTLTKGGTRALPFKHLFRPNRDAFACTITSLNARTSRKWERQAADPADRLAALRAFHDAGIYTWVSLEPTLNAAASLAIVDATCGFVDLYKVGMANYIPKVAAKIDWQDYTLRMIDRLQQLNKPHYIKRDLQRFLPPGYHNPLRVPQHH